MGEQSDMKKLLYILLLALLVAGQGCLKQERDECLPTPIEEPGNLHVLLTYTFEGEKLGDLVGDLRVFVFNEDGVLLDEIRAPKEDVARGRFNADLPAGNYTLIAWGVDGDDLHNGGYLTNAREGETRLEDFKLHLTDPTDFCELYYAMLEGVTIPEEGDIDVPMNFIRHTNVLRVTIKGMHRLVRSDDPPLDVFVTGKKGMYGHDGLMHDDAVEHIYPSSNHVEDNNELSMDVRILRLQMGYHEDNPLLLHVERNGAPFMEPLDILGALLMTPDYNTQEDLDRIYEHNIEIEINQQDLSVTVTINDYEIIYLDPGYIEPISPLRV